MIVRMIVFLLFHRYFLREKIMPRGFERLMTVGPDLNKKIPIVDKHDINILNTQLLSLVSLHLFIIKIIAVSRLLQSK
jgi:hypothetical protein